MSTEQPQLCYRCTQSRRLITAKLANFSPSHTNSDYLSEYSTFEEYLNSSNPLCVKCCKLSNTTHKHKVLKIKEVEKRKSSLSLLLLLLLLILLSCAGLLIYNETVCDWDEIKSLVNQVVTFYHSRVEQVYEMQQEPPTTLQLVYLAVLVIQLIVIIFHKSTLTSLLTFLLAGGLEYLTEYRPELIPPYITPTMILTTKLTLLLWSTISAVTSQRIVVKSSKIISPVKCPVKVRHSPNRTPSPSQTSSSRQRAPLNPSEHLINNSTNSNSLNSKADSGTTTASTPIKDVFSKMNIFSGSPTKRAGGPTLNGDSLYSKSLSSLSPNVTPVLPARGHLHPPKFTLAPDPKDIKKPRFDSYCEEEVIETLESADVVERGAVTMGPVIGVLVVSVMINFYLCLQYVLQ